MGTYKKSGTRVIKVENAKNVKRHLREFYKTINSIRSVANEIFILDVEYNEDNIDDYTRPFIGRDMDQYERFMMLGKIQSLRDEQKDNVK